MIDLRHRHRLQQGFTLVELIMVIVITGIIAGVVSVFIRQPVQGYVDLTRRAELVDAAESALRLMGRDIHRALPNSLRCNVASCVGATQVEMINTVDAVRYRAGPAGGAPDPAQEITFTTADTSFNAVGLFSNIRTMGVFPLAGSTAYRLVIYNLGTGTGFDAYNPGVTDAVITPLGAAISLAVDTATEDRITIAGGHKFTGASTRQRMFVVDGAIGYSCTGGFLRRYSGYGIPTTLSFPPASGNDDVVTADVTNCNFNYDAGTATRAGLISMSITLSSGGESVNLLHEVHVDNTP